MDKHDILRASNFGQRVAEDESDELEKYFVETDHWSRTYQGGVDVIYGPKGSGKSALYSLLIRRTDELFDRGVILFSAEKPRGTPVFRDMRQDPPTSEPEFVGLWKLYFLTLINLVLREYGATSESARTLDGYLVDAQLTAPSPNLSRLLSGVVRYVRSWFRPPKEVEANVQLDPTTGAPTGFGGKITFAEPDSGVDDLMSVDSLLNHGNHALSELGFRLWILLDRLDVAFAESPDLEEKALRALFRVYLDSMDLEYLCLKIFLRTDIWRRITQSGFREASHITRNITIQWDANSLVNLVVRRILKNPAINAAYQVEPANVLRSMDSQLELFYRVFPDRVDVGPNKSKTFQWILTRTTDGTGKPAPREIIHFLNAARDAQLRRHELGSREEMGEELLSRTSLRDALPEVSKVRLEQTLFAENPGLRPYIEGLYGQKTRQHAASLARIWNVDREEALAIANQLAEVGFFEPRGSKTEPYYGSPSLWRIESS